MKVDLPDHIMMLIGRSIASYFRHKTGKEPRKMMVDGVKVCSYPDWMKKHIDGSLFTCFNNPDTFDLYGINKKKLLKKRDLSSNKNVGVRPVKKDAYVAATQPVSKKKKRARMGKTPELITRSRK
jgi:hypothetical protein